ncbi:MAG: hypothetical protein SGARI_001865 [Bacillariaceae sp.]
MRFALPTLEPTPLFSLQLKSYMYGVNLVGIAHGKFLAVTPKSPRFNHRPRESFVQVYNLETGEVTHSEDCNDKLHMIQMAARHDTFCIHSGPGNIELVTVDPLTGTFSNRSPLKVNLPKIGNRDPHPVAITEKLLVTAPKEVAFQTYDLYRGEKQSYDATPKSDLWFEYFTEFTASIKRNTIFAREPAL